MPTTVYGDISPRTAAYASKELLERANPLLVLERFGQAKPLPEKSSKTIKFRRYNSLDPTPNPLTEGVTPSGKKMTATDVSASVVQYGDFIEISDVVQDTHEDPVLKEGMAVCGEQAANILEHELFDLILLDVMLPKISGFELMEYIPQPRRHLQRADHRLAA